jgi:hypothetical protein
MRMGFMSWNLSRAAEAIPEIDESFQNIQTSRLLIPADFWAPIKLKLFRGASFLNDTNCMDEPDGVPRQAA